MNPAGALSKSDGVSALALDLRAVYRDHSGFVARSLRRLGVPSADVDDLTQEVFLVAHRRSDSFDRRARLRTWLYGIALRVAKRHLRRPWLARERPLTADLELAEHASTPEHALQRSQAVQALADALSRLRPEQRAVLVLAELEDHPLREIACSMGTPIGTACSRLHLARKNLERELRRAGTLLAVLALAMLVVLGRAERHPAALATPAARTLQREPPAPAAAMGGELPSSVHAPSVPVHRAPAPKPRAHRATGKSGASAARVAHRPAEPAWLIEARRALATDPDRTLSLIRANRDPRVAVSPEIVELTLRAVDARRALQAQRVNRAP